MTVRAAVASDASPGTTWDLAGLGATLNGTPITGGGRFLTVTDPDVNLNDGVTITPATAVPGNGTATATDGDSLPTLLQRADAELYESKRLRHR